MEIERRVLIDRIENSVNRYPVYKTHGGAELDCLLIRDGKRFGFEFKYEDAPGPTKSMHVVFRDLKLERLCVIYPGDRSYPIGEKAEVAPLSRLEKALENHRLLR